MSPPIFKFSAIPAPPLTINAPVVVLVEPAVDVAFNFSTVNLSSVKDNCLSPI